MTDNIQNDEPQEEQSLVEKVAAFAGEMSGDHDTSNENEEIKQNQGYTTSDE